MLERRVSRYESDHYRFRRWGSVGGYRGQRKRALHYHGDALREAVRDGPKSGAALSDHEPCQHGDRGDEGHGTAEPFAGM